MVLHKGEHVVNMRSAVITVDRGSIPASMAVKRIGDIGRKEISNIPSAKSKSGSVDVEGTLYETDAALYFLSDHFINCHRLTSVISEHIDTDAVHVLEHGRQYSYKTPHADLFHLRSVFYHMAVAATENKEKSLIYLASENTMTLTPGIYSIPRNIRAGTYYISALNDLGLNLRDVNGHLHDISSLERVMLNEGTLLECTGEYQLRINPKKTSSEE